MKKPLLIFLTAYFTLAIPAANAQVNLDNEDQTEQTSDDDDDDDDEDTDADAADADTDAAESTALDGSPVESPTSDDDADDDTGDISLPEGMVSELDSLLLDWNKRQYLTQPDDDCRDTGQNPEFTKDDYIHRLQRLPNVIEMPYNEVVRKFIDQYTGRLRRSVSIMLGATNFYTPIFEEALEAYQLPLELKFLPVIESALNPKAVSRAGAGGLWQFMITTAKLYGLEVTSLIDERCDPIKSSYAAAHYLRELYGIFGNWTLVIAAYNCGPANVRKAISRAGGATDYWEIYPYLPRETRGYVPAFIAANYAMTYYCDHGICPVRALLPEATDTIHVTRNLHIDQVVAICNVPGEQVRALNPQYRTDLIPGDSHECTLRLPTAAVSAFIQSGDSIYRYHADELFTSRREIEVAEAKFTKKGKGRRGRNARNGRRGSSGSGATATVRRGDTLGAIAKRNGTTVANLRRLNGIRGNNIRAGQKIRVK